MDDFFYMTFDLRVQTRAVLFVMHRMAALVSKVFSCVLQKVDLKK